MGERPRVFVSHSIPLSPTLAHGYVPAITIEVRVAAPARVDQASLRRLLTGAFAEALLKIEETAGPRVWPEQPLPIIEPLDSTCPVCAAVPRQFCLGPDGVERRFLHQARQSPVQWPT